MKNKCNEFAQTELKENGNKFPPLRCLLDIDVMDILETFSDIGDFLLKEPLKFQSVCGDILFACLQTARDEPIQNVQPAQVAVVVRFNSLPKLLVPPNRRKYSGLVTFEGVLIAVSKPETYVYHTVWSCPEECEDSEVILHFIPKIARKCYVCRSILIENCGLRRCGEQVKATFKLDSSICSKDFNIADDLLSRLVLGSKYLIHAVVMQKLTVVLSLEEIVPLPAPITSTIPKDIKEMYQACDGVPWKFIYCLASCFGCNVCPLNCFMHLKISLLMSLSSVKGNMLTGSNIVHVLVDGLETRYVGEIMTDAARIADESIFLGTSNTSVSTALIASSGGVCIMPLPLRAYNQKQISAILTAVESGEVTTGTSKAKLQSAVWAQGMNFKKINVLNVANVFGTICRGDFDEYPDEIAEFVLLRAVESVEANEEEIKALKEVAVYVDLIAGIEVALDDSAENLLRHYFLSARRETPRGLERKSVSVGSMTALVATCVTSARLCRRNVANMDDAVLAIWLHVSGGREPRLAPEEFLQTPSNVKELNNNMKGFKEWLEQFTGTILF